MVELEFVKLDFVVEVTCISEDGELNHSADIISEIKDGLDEVFEDIMDRRNNVVAFELSDINGLDNGVDK